MKHLILLAGLLITRISGFAIDYQTLLQQGNTLYAKGDYAGAVAQYQTVVDNGYESSVLYFNLANAYYKTKNIKSAILNYERAKLLNPSDKDIDYNLELAKTLVVDKIEAMPELFFVSWTKWVCNRLTSGGWAIISLVSFLMGLVLLLFYLLSAKIIVKKLSFWVGTSVLVLSIGSFVFGYQARNVLTNRNTAIVFKAVVTTKSSPSESGTNLFVIHEGTKIEILDQIGDWREIRIADGNRGWVKASDIEKI